MNGSALSWRRRYDTGNKLDYLRTLVRFACERSDLAEDFGALAAQVPGQPPMSEAHTYVAEGETLTSVEEHLADILGTIRPLAPTELSLGDTHGLILAEDVTAASPLPSFDNWRWTATPSGSRTLLPRQRKTGYAAGGGRGGGG